MTDPVRPKRKFPIGELIALGALIISGLGLWHNWQNSKTGPTEVVERRAAVPLVLRGQVEDDGKRIAISPVDDGHALDSLSFAFPGGKTIGLGGDGMLDAGEVADILPDDVERDGEGRIVATVTAKYVEAGSDRTAKRAYAIAFRWQGGGLLSGKKLRLTGFSRA